VFRVTGIWGAVGLAIGGFMLADLLTHPAGTRAAGGAISNLWKTTAQGASGQKIA